MNLTKRSINSLLKAKKLAIHHSSASSVRGWHHTTTGFSVADVLEDAPPYNKRKDVVRISWQRSNTAHLYFSDAYLAKEEATNLEAAVKLLNENGLKAELETYTSPYGIADRFIMVRK